MLTKPAVLWLVAFHHHPLFQWVKNFPDLCDLTWCKATEPTPIIHLFCLWRGMYVGVFDVLVFILIVFQVLPDVLWVCQHGLRFADFTANP